MSNKPKTTFTYGRFVIEQFDVDGTVATFTGPGAGSAGKQYLDWLAHEPGTELEDLRVAVNEIDGALCNYCNQVADPYNPPSAWDATCEAAFKRLCDAYNDWHKSHDIVGEVSQKFWGNFEAELFETRKKLRAAEREIERVRAVSESRKNKKEVAHTARNDRARGLAYWRERAMEAEAKLSRVNSQNEENGSTMNRHTTRSRRASVVGVNITGWGK